MKRVDLWKLLLVLPPTFTLSTPVFAEDALAAPEAKETAPAAEEAPDSSDDGEALSKPAVKVGSWNIHQWREYTAGKPR